MTLADSFDICGLNISPAASGRSIRKADIAEAQPVRAVFEEFGPVDCVIHLAADSSAEPCHRLLRRSAAGAPSEIVASFDR